MLEVSPPHVHETREMLNKICQNRGIISPKTLETREKLNRLNMSNVSREYLHKSHFLFNISRDWAFFGNDTEMF